MRHIGIFLSLCWLSLANAQQERTWTATSGKTVIATMIGIEGETVLLHRPGKEKIFRAPLTVFSNEDREYVREISSLPNQSFLISESVSGPIKNSIETPADWVNKEPLIPAADMKIEVIDAKTYRLATFGTIEIPGEYMFWHVTSLNPPVFRARVSPEATNLMFMKAAPKQTQRRWILERTYNGVVRLMLEAGITEIRGSAVDVHSELPDRVRFAIVIKNAEGKTFHFANEIRFDADYTKVFQSSSQDKRRAIDFLKTANTFKPASKPATNSLIRSPNP